MVLHCLDRFLKIFNKYLDIPEKHFYIFNKNDLYHLKYIKKEIYNNISFHVKLLDTDKYIKELTELYEKLYGSKNKDLEEDLKEFFESKEFKELQNLERKSWYHKLDELLSTIELLLPEKEENYDDYLFKINTLSILIKECLVDPERIIDTNLNKNFCYCIEICLDKESIETNQEYIKINITLKEILTKLKTLNFKTLLKDKF